jgi:hypothetical protein
MSAVRLYKKAVDNTFDYKHFNIKKINIQFDNGNTGASFRASVTAVKDTAVQISITKLNILLARVLLTPDSVTYVNYFDKTYFRGNYEPVSELLNFNFDFPTIQAIVSANIFSLFQDRKELRDYKTWTDKGMYVLQSEAVRKLTRMEAKGKTHRMERFLKRKDEEISVIQTFYFDPELYVIRLLEMKDKDSPRNLVLHFDNYEPVGTKFYPSSVSMVLHSDSLNLEIHARMSGFSSGDEEFFPLKVPEKYDRIFLN